MHTGGISRGLVTRDFCKKKAWSGRDFSNYRTVVCSEIISTLTQSKENLFPSWFNLSESILFFKFSGREPLYTISISIACLQKDIVTSYNPNWDMFDSICSIFIFVIYFQLDSMFPHLPLKMVMGSIYICCTLKYRDFFRRFFVF